MKRCRRCGLDKPNSAFSRESHGYLLSHCKNCLSLRAMEYRRANLQKYRDYANRWRCANQVKITEKMKQQRHRDRAAALIAYGDRCACCGEQETLFLEIDHVNGGGGQQRKELRSGRFLRWLRKSNYPPEFQILCRNCNYGKWRNGGTCPHLDKGIHGNN